MTDKLDWMPWTLKIRGKRGSPEIGEVLFLVQVLAWSIFWSLGQLNGLGLLCFFWLVLLQLGVVIVGLAVVAACLVSGHKKARTWTDWAGMFLALGIAIIALASLWLEPIRW
jgi:hypothetical protein